MYVIVDLLRLVFKSIVECVGELIVVLYLLVGLGLLFGLVVVECVVFVIFCVGVDDFGVDEFGVCGLDFILFE